MQREEQARLSAIHRVNKAIEWVTKEKSKEADNAIADKAQPQQSTSEPVSSISKMQNAKAEMYLDSKTSSEYGETSIKELIDNRIRDGWTLVSGWKEDKAAGKKLDDELAYLRRNAPIGNKNHPETQRLKELTDLTKGDTYRDGNFFIKEETNRLESPSGKLMALNKTAYEYAKTKAVQSAKPTPVTQPESEPTPTASTSSSDLSDEEYIALQKAYNDFKAKTDKINATYSRDVALEIATGLVAEMPDKEDKIRQALIDAIRENQWNRFEINFPKQPIKVETDVELNRALKRLQKALEGTDYTVNGAFNGKSAKLLFSYKSGANGSRESVIIDRINGKFTSYHVDFDNMSREFLKPLMDATVKWLNGEEIPKMKLGDDSQWDYTTLLSTPRHIDNAFNEAKANAPTVSKSDKLAQSYDEAKAKQQPAKEEAPKQEANVEKTKGFTENQKPTKPFSAPSENLPETTIMRFLNDGELENAYFFAENQKKPIRFTLSNKKEPIAYFLTEPVDLGNNITGFVGISTLDADPTVPMSKSRRWLVIEEKSRTSLGFEEISKQAAIKSAKARLSALKKEDLDRLSSTLKPINKTDQEMSVEWLAKNNIKTDDEKTEQQSTSEPIAELTTAKEEAPKQEANSKTPTLDKHNALMDSVHDNQTNEDKPQPKDSNEVIGYSDKHPSWATKHEKDVGGHIVYSNNDYALLEGFSVANGMPVYTFVSRKQDSRSVYDVESYTGKDLPSTDKDFLVSMKKQHMEESNKKHQLKPNLNFKDGQNVAHSDGVPVELADIATQWLKMLGIESKVFITTIEDTKGRKNADKYGFHGAYAAIRSAGVDPNEGGSTRRLSNGTHYIAIKLHPRMSSNLETLAHEIGHILEKETWKSADVSTKNAIISDFNKWVLTASSKNAKQWVRELRSHTTGKLTDIPNNANAAQLSSYWRSFSEYFADQVAKWATSSEQPRSVVDVFFSKLGGALKKFFASATGKDYLPANSMKKYLDELAKTNNPLQGSYKQQAEEKAEPKQPTKKESLLIKIDDELDSALDGLAAIFKEQGKRLSSGVDPVIMGKVLAIGMKASTLYLAKGAVKFAVWAENMINGLSSKGVSADVVKPYLKQLYLASKVDISPEIRKQMDKEDDVYDFDFATLNVDQEEKTDSTGKTPTKETLTDLFYKHLKQGTLPENNVNLRKMVAEFDGKEVDNYRLKEAQEMLEAAIARHSRDVVASNHNGDASTFSRGIVTTQTRAILVKHFGEKLIKALEAMGLITIMDSPPSWAEPDADGAYHNGKSYLFASNLTPETVVATFVHELGGHKGFQELMTPTAYASLMRQFNRLVKQGNAIALAAKARAEAVEVVTPTADTKEAIALAEKQTLQRQQDELLPYLLTLQATLNATRSQQSAVTKVIEQVYRAVKAWLYRTLSAKGYDGLASKLLQPKDITLLAERMIREMGGDLSGKTPNELQERRAMIQGLSFMGAASALGGGITLVDMSMKARDAKKIIDDILTKGKEGITPSKEFLAVIEKMANAKESVAARKRAASIVEGFITKLRGELLENSQLSGKIAINAKNIKTGEAIFIDAKDAHHESKRMFDAMTEQRKKIESQIVLAASMVESITGYKLNDLVIIPKPDSTIELLVGKQLTDDWREFGFVGASTEWQEGIKINVNAQTLIDLASGSSVIRAGAFSLIAHEMTHAIQHQLLPLNTRDSKVLGVDTFIPDGISAMHKAWLSENPDKYSSQEDSANYKAEKEGFDVGYTAAKAMLKKEGLPLRIISERDLENALLTAAQDTTSTVEALDKFNKANYSDDIRFSQLNTPQTQINAVRKKYEGTSQWMKAPNGQPTKLNEVQWLQVRTPNFKAWFGDWENDPKNASKVVDSNGEPMVVYHGTEYGGFTEFGSSGYGAASREKGFWFSNKIRALEYSGKNQEIEIVPVLKSWSDAAYFAKKLDVEFKKAPEDEYDDGIYFIDDDIASTLNQARNILQKAIEDKQPAGIYPVFLSLKTPKTINAKGKLATNINTLVMSDVPKKYDGMMIVDVDDAGRFGDYGYITDNYVAKTSTQIKSATENNGEFNPTNPDIRFSRKAKNPIAEGIKSAANDAKNSLPKPISGKIDHFLAGRRLPSSDLANIVSKTELSLYHRTISTQQNTALQLPDFKKVYDMAQRYLQHVAVDAYAALKVAPNLLGKLESWSDLKKDVKKIWPANFIKQKADRAAVASIIFDETLNNELLSDADILKALTRDQRQIYKEARDAIQVSLENTAKSEMVRKLLAAEAINWQTVESLINQDLPVEQFAQTVRDMVESRIGGFKNELEAILDADPKIKDAFKTGNKNKLIPAQKKELKKALTLKAQIETTEEALKSLNDVENRLGTLIEQGYAPLMRFGEYTLTVRDLDGKVKSFFMFESKSEQARAANAIVARYGKTVNLETDMISKEEFKQFAGMTPETMALFAKETGMDKDEAYQHYLKLAIPARSAMTRMIKRKGTEGFSDDIQRVVASFVMSNARMSAKNIYAAQIEKSIQDIESGKSVKDQAIVMKENVFNPKENFAQLRNFLFLWNLGGSIFFGLLNMTQPYMQTLPHLSQYVPIGDATRAILRGSKIAGSAMKNGTAPKGYEAEYNRAVREGVVDPQNVFMLSGVERGKTGASNSAWGVITHTMGLIAQVTESFNRKAVFIASLQVAKQKGDVWLKKKGFNSAYDFAKDTVDQTQGVYDKANRSNWANTSVGAPLMVFKQFSINYVEQMVRMWKKEAASGDEGKKAVFLMLAMLASLSGMMGLPFIKDILDVSETTAAFLGNPVNIEREARLALGKDLADPLFNGVLNHFIFNQLGVDTQSRTGMPDLLPWTNIANPTLKGAAFTRELMGLTGATGGLINKVFDSAQLAAEGNVGAAAKTLAPRFLTSWIDGGKMALTNEVMDRKGNKLFDTTWDEGLVKFIDANPKRMADLSRTKSLEWKDKSIQAYMTTNFKQKIIAAMMDNDQAEVQNLMKKVQEWNTSRPKYPVFINLNTLSKNANKKDQTFDARESIPKGMDWMKNERPEM
jgi:hypothetical protein